MNKSKITSISRMCTASTLGISLALTLGLPVAHATIASEGTVTQSQGSLDTGALTNAMKQATGTVSVFVQFQGRGAFESTQSADVLAGKAPAISAVNEVKAIQAAVEAQAQSVASDSKSQLLYTTHNALRGAAIQGNADDIRKLAERSDVVKITPLIAKTYQNSNTDQLTQAVNTWTRTGYTGKGVKIAVLDTGLDYTHADFGGPGTQEAYDKAKTASEMPVGLYDSNKVIGGYDLVGDNYNGSNIPSPDNNPLDCQLAGHGTHVAGTAAGYGENADGTTFKGDYSTLTSDAVKNMKIGPGSAPQAQLISLRIFGCDGSTSTTATAAGLDRVLDPNGDGDFSDRANIVNMSLGTDFAADDDPENDMVNALTRAGVLSVVAAGNSAAAKSNGDTYSVSGAPGSAVSALTVANSVGPYSFADKGLALSPSDVTGDVLGDYSADFDYSKASESQLTSTKVVMAPENNKYACNPFDPSVNFDGAWVYIDWNAADGSYPCGSKVRFDNIEKAGGKGVILSSTQNVQDAGIAGNSTIPGIRLTKDETARLLPAIKAGTFKVQLKNEWHGAGLATTNATDTLNTSSARGAHGNNNIIKPDVSDPGTSIKSAAVGGRTLGNIKTGTSMATPHVAGIAALVLQAHQSYTPQNIKSAIMNSANHEVKNSKGVAYAVDQVGAGRVDALAAVNTDVLVYNSDTPDLVSETFGVVEVKVDGGKSVLTRKITIENKGDKAHTYATSLAESTTMPGVSLSVDKQSVTVAPHSKTEIVLTATMDPHAMDKTMDPAQQSTQAEGYARQYVSSVSGRLLLTEGSNVLRIPVHIAPKPSSTMKASVSQVVFPDILTSSTSLTLQGGAVDAKGYKSAVGAFQLGATSPRIPTAKLAINSLSAVDLMAVGASSSAPELVASGGKASDGIMNIGISTWGNWDTLNLMHTFQVDLDTDKDGKANFTALVTMSKGLDYPVVGIYSIDSYGQAKNVSIQPLNGSWGNVDTNTMDTNVMVVPIPLKALGLTEAQAAQLRYQVSTITPYQAGGTFDSTNWISYNPYSPEVWVTGKQKFNDSLLVDSPDNKLTVNRVPGYERSLMLLHMHNTTGDLTGMSKNTYGNKTDIIKLSSNGNATYINPRFTDVPTNSTFYKEISWLADRGITRGFDDGTYRPTATVDRGVMAAFFYRMAGSPQYTPPTTSRFTDVPTTHIFYKEISWMADQGIAKGWSDGTYRPDAPVGRDAMAAFFYRMAGSPSYLAPEKSPFTDVQPGDIFYKEISWLSEQHITNGWPDGTYRPYTAIQRDAMAAFIYRYNNNVLSRG